MNMCMPAGGAALMFHLNQFAVYSTTSGPRGRSRLTGPGTWMITYSDSLTSQNRLSVNVMGSPEQLTVGDRGTPQLLQTETIDAMHAHDTIMALEIRDAISFGADGNQRMTVQFAPRGEAAVGPVPFMHRESAEGNPDAPLGHGLQDGFHDASTVLGIEYQVGRSTIEVTGFSGQSTSWPFPLHRLDSYGVRFGQDLGGHVHLGASYADVLLPDETGGAEHNRFISAWLSTSHRIHGGSLRSSFIWGQGRADHGVSLNSFLEEAAYQHRQDRIYGRAEVLQITPDQLGLAPAGGDANARWVSAFTVGYERAILEQHGLRLLAGGSYTRDVVTGPVRSAYGSDPTGLKVYLRATFVSQ